MIAAGEANTVEFMPTLRVNLRTGEPDKDMEHEALKNIAAFLNTDGGTLIIGVNDYGEPLGLDQDGFTNEDETEQYLCNIVNNQIGTGAWENINVEFASYQSKRILVIRCMKSSDLVYVGKDEQVYTRTSLWAPQLRLGDEVTELIAAGESKTVEFKETLRGLRGDGKPEHAVLKSIAGLLNSDGGHLFVGIRDDGGASGIDDELKSEFKNSEDEALQYLANVIKDRMTPGASNRVHPAFHAHRGVRILVIRCDQSPDQVTVRETDGSFQVYARRGPTTTPLKPHEVLPHFTSRVLQPGATESDE